METSEVPLMLIHAAHQYITNPVEVSVFYSALFHKAELSLVRLQCEINDTLEQRDVATVVRIRESSLTVMPTISRTESFRFRNTMRLAESGSGNDRSKMSGSSLKREKYIPARVRRYLYPLESLQSPVLTGSLARMFEERLRGVTIARKSPEPTRTL